MTDSALTSLSFDKYFFLAKRVLPQLAGVGVCDGYGNPVWFSPDLSGEQLAVIVDRYKQAVVSEDGHSNGLSIKCDHNRTIYSRALQDRLDRNYGTILAVVEIRGPDVSQDVTDMLDIVESFLAEECLLTDELSAMAGELSQRYDELNLVYHTSDQVSGFSEGQEALQGLVKSCVEYLNVDMAALLLPEKANTILHWGERWSSVESSGVLAMVNKCFYPWVIENRESLVINALSDPQWQKIDADFYCKLLCSPIVSENNEVYGILVTAGQYDREDFTNADRHLLEIMARKVAKVVQVSFDTLTGLLNRRSFETLLEDKLSELKGSRQNLVLLHVNIDQLQVVNDTVSMQAGDILISQVGKILVGQLRDIDIVGRLGADSFTVLLDGCSIENAERVSEKLCSLVSELNLEWQGHKFPTSVSVGVLSLGEVAQSAQHALASAELACDMAKQSGRNRVQTYSDSSVDIVRRKQEMSWVNVIHSALRDGRFRLYAQGIYAAEMDGEVHHYEILLRLLGEDGEILAPGSFMPAAEHYRFMPAIDRWVLTETLTTLEQYQQQLADSPVSWAINLSGQSLGFSGFKSFVLDKVKNSPFPSNKIGFEVTETVAFENISVAEDFIIALKSEGCLFYLDDFGTGLSSFDYLKSLPLDFIKIDGKFVRDILNDPVSGAMVTAINQVGQVMGMKTIAEFVENEAIWKHLIEMGVDFGQGYALAKPRPIEEVLSEISCGVNA